MDIPTKLNQYINQDKYSQVKHNKFFDQELKLLLDQTIFNYYIHIIKNIKLNNLAMQNYATEKYQLIYNNALINGFSYDWNPKKSNIN